MGPFKCPDCGIWWAGFEHRCRWEMSLPAITTNLPFDTTTTTVRCTCPPNRGDNYLGRCLIHDVQVTYT